MQTVTELAVERVMQTYACSALYGARAVGP
jgi:hypothetical protein